jgi:peptide/nickel transport system substrate-binding protein
MFRPRYRVLVVAALVAWFAISSFGNATSLHAAAGPHRTLFQASISELDGLDPAVGQDAGSKTVHMAIYEPLVAYKIGTSEVEPRLATSWSVSKDGRAYTFKLRQGVKFQGGGAFDANAVKVSFDRVKKLGLGASYLLSEYDRAVVVNALTVTIYLKRPLAAFIRMVPGIFIVNPARVKEHAADLGKAWFAANADGTGPYRLEKWDRGSQAITLVRFDGYWQGWQGSHFDRVIKKVIAEPSTQVLMLKAGDADFIQRYTLDSLTELAKDPNIQVKWYSTINAFVLVLANNRKPLSDVRVRQALAYAFPYDKLIDVVYEGHADRLVGPLPSSMPYFDKTLKPYTRDLVKAKQLLATAGYPNGGFTLQLKVVEGIETMITAAQLMQAAAKEIGITINIQQVQWPSLVALFQDPKTTPDIFPLFQFPAFADPDAIFSVNYDRKAQRTGGYNGGYFGTAESDSLIARARAATSDQERARLYAQLQRMILEDSVNIFLASPQWSFVARKAVKGFNYTPALADQFPYYQMYWDER